MLRVVMGRGFMRQSAVTVLVLQFVQFGNGGNFVIFIQPDQFYSLGSPALFADAIYRHPDRNAALTGDHQVFLFRDVQYPYETTRLTGHADGLDPLPSPIGDPVFIDGRPFAISLFANNQYGYGS